MLLIAVFGAVVGLAAAANGRRRYGTWGTYAAIPSSCDAESAFARARDAYGVPDAGDELLGDARPARLDRPCY